MHVFGKCSFTTLTLDGGFVDFLISVDVGTERAPLSRDPCLARIRWRRKTPQRPSSRTTPLEGVLILPQFALPGGHGVAPLWIFPPPRRRACRGHLFFRPGLSSLMESGLTAVHGQIRLSASAMFHVSGHLEVNRCTQTSNLQADILALTESICEDRSIDC